MDTDKGTSPVIAALLMVAVVVILSGVIFVTAEEITTQARQTNERPVPVTGELLFNEGFESGDNGVWQKGDGPVPPYLESDAHIVARNARFGSSALKMNESAEFTGQNVTDEIDDGTTYRMCAYTMVDDPSGAPAYVGVQYYDASGAIVDKDTFRVTWTAYEERCVLTDIPDDSGVVEAEVWAFRDPSGTTAGTLYVDEVSLVQVRYFGNSNANPYENG
ncbi:type IV pilin [Salinigranum sp.]|uniref:type IV pilin n=1 Tax=Salinigranum sp. TaxID=1966351 RepID=UPI003564F8DF